MILTVTPNLALDVTYPVRRLTPGRTHRIGAVWSRAGGKGVNVARVLTGLGHPASVLGFAGGPERTRIVDELHAAGIAHELVHIDGATRRTVSVVSTQDGDATLLNEPGPEITGAECDALLAAAERRVPGAGVLVCSGSLPPGMPEDSYARLVTIAAAHHVPAIVDSSGPALRAALAAGPALVKPNLDELRELTGVADPSEGARRVLELGARSCVVSLGAPGMLAVTGEGSWYAEPSGPLGGNPTGAGDAAVAALAIGLRAAASWPEILVDAVALSSAAVLAPQAGSFDAGHYAAERPRVRVRTAERGAR